jgi:protein PhnA
MFSPHDFKIELSKRSDNRCEICSATDSLDAVEVASVKKDISLDTCVLLCETCRKGTEKPASVNSYHWTSMQEAIWSEVPAVQVLSWRICNALSTEAWAQDLLSQMYLDEDTQEWAENDGKMPVTLDSNGIEIQNGDSVYIIKDLVVKGAGFTAKRGTTVRNVRLTLDPDYIEGKVNGTSLMLKTCFMKKV